MKKQMQCLPYKWPCKYIRLYHDGKLIEEKIIVEDAVNDYIEELEQQGYTKGYTKQEVEESRQIYENQLQNIIEEI